MSPSSCDRTGRNGISGLAPPPGSPNNPWIAYQCKMTISCARIRAYVRKLAGRRTAGWNTSLPLGALVELVIFEVAGQSAELKIHGRIYGNKQPRLTRA